MESAVEGWPNYGFNLSVPRLPSFSSRGSFSPPLNPALQSPSIQSTNGGLHKRTRLPCDVKSHGNMVVSAGSSAEPKRKKARTDAQVVDYSDPFAVPNLLDELDTGKFGSVTEEIKDLIDRKTRLLHAYYARCPKLVDTEHNMLKEASKLHQPATPPTDLSNVIELDDDSVVVNDAPTERSPIVVIDSDDEQSGEPKSIIPYQGIDQKSYNPYYDRRSFNPYPDILLRKQPGEFRIKDFLDMCVQKGQNINLRKDNARVAAEKEAANLRKDNAGPAAENETANDKGVYVGVEDDCESREGNDQSDSEYDGLADIWKEMTVALECSKDTAEDLPPDEHMREGEDECDHSFVLKDDLGYVCRICGVIQRGIETIIEYQYAKGTRTTRTYSYEARTVKDKDASETFHDAIKLPGQDFTVTDISAHPRHMKQMKPHQVEGFNFLLCNLVAENPGGCIMAHAPGSGKTFMIISFMQSFLAKYPHARPLVVLPKGILATWKKEFQRWQVEDIPLFDFYSVKADNRPQQLEVLKQWAGQRSILFLGYKQFSTIVCDDDTSKAATACQEILRTYPSILVLDEGHTPRNENTDVLNSLKTVQTPRKVVLSGTLYQNHVKEVFNVFDLVRPKFLRLDTSRAIIRRILSRVPSVRKHVQAKGLENVFYESVERMLQKEDNFKRKVTVIQDLREMTRKVLHFYKGDFLDELPGLVDFTVFLNLTPRQKHEAEELKKLARKFKISSDGSALYVHPKLRQLLKNTNSRERDGLDDAKMDQLLEQLDVREGVKAKFFLNMLRLCESSGEKLLVFSPYLQPLKFLERLAVKVKGWSLGREIFVITGDSSSENREWSMERFNTSPDARVFLGSIKACGEGISLVGASRIIILDVHLNPSVTRQAIGRAFRPGQEKKVYTYRLVAADSPEEEDHSTCFRKESIAKMWFEWNEYCGQQEFEMETVDIKNCGDQFLESPKLSEDVKALYRR
ncbi:DNA helicase [Bertholletia excelsa]